MIETFLLLLLLPPLSLALADSPNEKTSLSKETEPTLKEEDKEKGTHDFMIKSRWCRLKMRPGINHFLTRISLMYDICLYTTGSRIYAEKVVELLGEYNRKRIQHIVANDVQTSLIKTLKLVPQQYQHIVIMDDRMDHAWEPKYHSQLIHVIPYLYFTEKYLGDLQWQVCLPVLTEKTQAAYMGCLENVLTLISMDLASNKNSNVSEILRFIKSQVLKDCLVQLPGKADPKWVQEYGGTIIKGDSKPASSKPQINWIDACWNITHYRPFL
jgi:hypothetical protein